MIIMSIKDAQDLIDKSINGIDFLLKRFKELDGLTNDVYEALAVLDDLVIEYEDTRRSYLQQQKLYNKLRLKKGLDNELQTNNKTITQSL